MARSAFHLLLVLLVMIGHCWGSLEAAQVNPALASSLRVSLDGAFAPFDVKGCPAAVLLSDGAMWLGVAGVSHGAAPVTPDMLFGVGSVTKNYVAPLVLQLAEEGVLTLDDTLSQWLPERPFIDPGVGIRQLLNQRSGLCNVTDSEKLWDDVLEDPAANWTPQRVLDEYVEEPCMEPVPGWHYSNTGFLLVGMIIEQATGTTVAEELRRRFFEPLGLNRTFFCGTERFPEETVLCHGWFDLDGDGIPDDVASHRETICDVLWTSAAIYATAEDLARWVDVLLRGGILSAEALEQMITPYSIVPGSGGVGYGLGVNLYGTEGIGHSGRTFGYLSLFLHLPQQGATVVVLINGDDARCLDTAASALTMAVIDPAK